MSYDDFYKFYDIYSVHDLLFTDKVLIDKEFEDRSVSLLLGVRHRKIDIRKLLLIQENMVKLDENAISSKTYITLNSLSSWHIRQEMFPEYKM